MTQITYTKQLDPEIEKKMEADIIKYEASNGVDVNYHKFSLVCHNDSNEVIGLINAYTAYAEIYIDDFWIDSKYRHQGYGSMLVKALETRFISKGFNNINLVTSQFQAPGFYKKLGFELEFIRENKYNPKLTKYFFVKFFNDIEQHQGLLKS